ncbi:U32 family peptidase [Ferrimonas sp. SCSIO 43195]|uniref:U32 family peptidase n=1 Tax=Ferrimonas sp. SCSIO 43195 TaxID=2822844 RepID=UPI00207584CC|nr:U32 family peptidase [Ferrimonas sp. SCSIO 43195]USD36816.1 U32 family peptidase [Ferrimonas sp. SCSIO 43195]
MKLSLTLNSWPLSRQQQQQQLQQLSQLSVDRVYLGETVCEKRDRPALRTLLEYAETASHSGKQVVLSTLNLVNGPRELKLVENVCRQSEFLVEASDLTAVQLMAEQKRPFWASANLNLYNLDSLRWMQSLGAIGFTPPIDISDDNAVRLIAESRESLIAPLSAEMIGFGWPVLAVSARCATARIQGRNKQHCDKICQQRSVPLASTLEGQNLLHINGPQSHGARPVDRLDAVHYWQQQGVEWMRLVPGPSLDADWLSHLSEDLAAAAPFRRHEIPAPTHKTAIG